MINQSVKVLNCYLNECVYILGLFQHVLTAKRSIASGRRLYTVCICVDITIWARQGQANESKKNKYSWGSYHICPNLWLMENSHARAQHTASTCVSNACSPCLLVATIRYLRRFDASGEHRCEFLDATVELNSPRFYCIHRSNYIRLDRYAVHSTSCRQKNEEEMFGGEKTVDFRIKC